MKRQAAHIKNWNGIHFLHSNDAWEERTRNGGMLLVVVTVAAKQDLLTSYAHIDPPILTQASRRPGGRLYSW